MCEDIILMLTAGSGISNFLHAVPHSSFMDMTVCYFRRSETWEDGEHTGFDLDILLNREMRARGIEDTDSLYESALANTEKYLPPVVEKMAGGMICITNDQHVFGAAAMMYEGLLQNVSELMGSDMYVIPSSVHEVICVEPEKADPADIYEYIRYANKKCLEPRDVLSNSLYYYDAAQQKLMIAYGEQDHGVCISGAASRKVCWHMRRCE